MNAINSTISWTLALGALCAISVAMSACDDDEDPFAEYDCQGLDPEEQPCLAEMCEQRNEYLRTLEQCGTDTGAACSDAVDSCAREAVECLELACPAPDDADGAAMTRCRLDFSHCVVHEL